MGERAPYSRVYWTIIDDERFANVYKSDAALATWLRLLLIADQSWPASAHIPARSSRRAVRLLSAAGLIETIPGQLFRIHGLDAERERRSAAATRRSPSGTQLVLRRGLDETRRDTRAREVDVDNFDARVAATQRMLRQLRGDA